MAIEILRRFAESTMHSLVRQIFYRLHSLDPETEENKIQKAEEVPETSVKMTMQGLQEGDTKADPVPESGDVSVTGSPADLATVTPPVLNTIEPQTPAEPEIQQPPTPLIRRIDAIHIPPPKKSTQFIDSPPFAQEFSVATQSSVATVRIDNSFLSI